MFKNFQKNSPFQSSQKNSPYLTMLYTQELIDNCQHKITLSPKEIYSWEGVGRVIQQGIESGYAAPTSDKLDTDIGRSGIWSIDDNTKKTYVSKMDDGGLIAEYEQSARFLALPVNASQNPGETPESIAENRLTFLQKQLLPSITSNKEISDFIYKNAHQSGFLNIGQTALAHYNLLSCQTTIGINRIATQFVQKSENEILFTEICAINSIAKLGELGPEDAVTSELPAPLEMQANNSPTLPIAIECTQSIISIHPETGKAQIKLQDMTVHLLSPQLAHAFLPAHIVNQQLKLDMFSHIGKTIAHAGASASSAVAHAGASASSAVACAGASASSAVVNGGSAVVSAGISVFSTAATTGTSFISTGLNISGTLSGSLRDRFFSPAQPTTAEEIELATTTFAFSNGTTEAPAFRNDA